MTDLNELISRDFEGLMSVGNSINSAGQITGDASISGSAFAVLLTPIGASPADLDGDCRVGIIDFLTLLANWGPCPDPCPPACVADIDGDCMVGILDFLALLLHWG